MKVAIKLVILITIFLAVVTSAYYFIAKHSLESKTQDQKMSVTASFYPLADFAKKIGGDTVRVQILIPSGVEPHEYDPSPRDFVALNASRMFIYNGLGFEPWVSRIASDARAEHVIVIDSSNGIQADKASNAQFDPHIWIDPMLALEQVKNILNGFIAADPPNRIYYEARAQNFFNELENLDRAFQSGLATCKRKDIIVAHNAFGYLAKRYHFNVVPIVGFSPEDEPSPQKLAKVITFAKDHEVKYILFERLMSPRVSETIAHETGAQMAVLNPIEGLTAREAQTGKDYIAIQMENLNTLRKALDCI